MSNERKSGPSPTRLAHACPVRLRREGHELVARDHLEAELLGHRRVLGAVERAAHPGEERPRGIQQPFLEGTPKRRAVVVALSDVRVPDVCVSIEENEPERAVHGGMRPQLAEHDGVVAAETERPRAGAHDRLEALGDLRRRALRVPGRDRDVTEVRDGERAEDLHVLRRVVRPQRDRRRPHRLGAEPRARPVRRARVERDAEHRDVDALGIVRERAAPERANAGVPRSGERVGRLVARASARVSRGDGTSGIGWGQTPRA